MARISKFLAVVLAIAVAGCARTETRKPVFAISGKATFQNEPMAGAMISFHPLNDPGPRALRAQATVNRDGTFRMTTYDTGDGAPAGEYAVTVYWPSPRPAKPKSADPSALGEEEEITPDRLKRQYAVPATTKLRAVVREEANTFDLILP
jgi:hypothetical protein